MAITASIVKELRDQTGAGMMDCKKALVDANGDMEAAVDFLRKSGMAKAEKKSSRATKEGKIVSELAGDKGVLAEILCETDFVAKTDKFIEYTDAMAKKILAGSGNGCISEEIQVAEKEGLTEMIATIGENMQIRRVARWESAGQVYSYLHMGGRIGVLVDVEGDADDAFLHDLCMHIAAFNPQYTSPEEVPAELIEKEKEIAKAQLEGKPENIIDNILKGKINKWYTEICLTKQAWIKDDKSCLDKVKPGIKVNRFIRWELGEEL